MAKFSVGEKARIVYTRYESENIPEWQVGAIVTVTVVRSGKVRLGAKTWEYDYIVEVYEGCSGTVLEDQLEKLIGDEDRSSWEEIEKITQWNPTTVEVE